MEYSNLERLRQVTIAKPCPANWDEMSGNARERHCAGCGCSVNNIAEMTAKEAESLLNTPQRVCIRVACDRKQRILTKDGWIPRAVAMGAIAATVAGCASSSPTVSPSTTASVSSTTPTFVDNLVEFIEKIYEEVADFIVPSRKKVWYVAGAMAPMTMPTSPVPTTPTTPKSTGTLTVSSQDK